MHGLQPMAGGADTVGHGVGVTVGDGEGTGVSMGLGLGDGGGGGGTVGGAVGVTSGVGTLGLGDGSGIWQSNGSAAQMASTRDLSPQAATITAARTTAARFT